MADPTLERSKQAGRLLADLREDGGRVTVVHHIDADGVSSGAIALEALSRLGIEHDSIAVKSLDAKHIELVQKAHSGATDHGLWFCDLGSTAYPQFPDAKRIICDHHQLLRDGSESFEGHVNPLLDDTAGDCISGSGTAFLVAREIDSEVAMTDLLPLALVGATGDLQDRHGGFHGLNAQLAEEAKAAGLIDVRWDLAFYGPESRPLTKFLGYANDRPIPGISNPRSASEFCQELGISNPDRTTWSQLDATQKTILGEEIVDRLLHAGIEDIGSYFRPVIRIRREAEGTMLRELQEYSTLLNSTARYGKAEVGLAVARGDRGKQLELAMDLITNHRKHLMESLTEVQVRGLTHSKRTQWVHVEDTIRDTVVGIVMGMCLDAMPCHPDKPIIGFAYADAERTKISARAPRSLQGRVNLAAALTEVAEALGGAGGGHEGAAGATIPRGSEADFIAGLDGALARNHPNPDLDG